MSIGNLSSAHVFNYLVLRVKPGLTNCKDLATALLVNITLIGHNSSSIHCENDCGLQFINCSNITITNITWSTFITNRGNTYDSITPQIEFYNSSNITIDHCTFQQSVGQAVVLSEVSGDVNIKHCKFLNSIHSHREHGTAIHYSSNCTEFTKERLTISDCDFTDNIGIASLIYLERHINNSKWCESITLQNSKFDNNRGVCVYLSNQNLYIKGNVTFDSNIAENGAGIFISDHSNVKFGKASNVMFAQNRATVNGGALHVNNWSSVVFESNAHVMFISNEATKSGGTIYSYNNSIIILRENAMVCFIYSNAEFGGTLYAKNSSFNIRGNQSKLTINNSEAIYGGAIYFKQNSSMTITENTMIEFWNNEAREDGGCIYSDSDSSIMFTGNSITKLYNCRAIKGGGINSYNNSMIEIDAESEVTFNENSAEFGGTLYIDKNSFITTKGKSRITVSRSQAINGGASYLTESSNMTITDDSLFVIFNNKAEEDGGGIYSNSNSTIIFKGNSTINFTNNKAKYGGAIYSVRNSNIEFKNISTTIFNRNEVTQNGGCIFIEQSKIQFKESIRVTFNNSVAFTGAGGAIFCAENSNISFINCDATFYRNRVYNGDGGAICCSNSVVVIEGASSVEFDSNQATDGGAIDFNINSKLLIRNNTIVTFNDNSATMGGAVNFHDKSNGIFEMNSTLVLRGNNASKNGGVFHIGSDTHIEFKQLRVEFNKNNAKRGGAIYLVASTNIYKMYSTMVFKNNTALQDGGAIYIADYSHLTFMKDTNVVFSHNRASDYGGAIYGEMIESTINLSNSSNISYLHNSARTGRSVYINLPVQCNSTCLANSVLGISTTDNHIITSPSKIELYNSNVHCVNDTECDLYYINNIMLGQKIILDACIYDYYGHPVSVARLLLSGTNNQGYRLDSNNTLITCNHTLELVSIYGNESIQFNYLINISLYDNRQSESKEVLTKLMVELSTCHPGFSNKKSQKCECYNASDIVFCSGSSSTIKRGYWFGSVTGIPTVTFCPINYCNFTCCETSNGYYHLSPVRDNQCRSHRSGAACGSCTDGYTLSFDSTECVNIKNCTAGHTVLVILLSIIYWIVMVTLVFGIMYYKVEIGYLYGITYYYSIVDILLSQNLYASRGLYLTVIILSSFSKIIPQFLGELCLSTELSGIDQQFIHYIHPTAVVVILGIISLSARISRRVSVFISRGVIHVICLLLLLSYTSVTSTSLLLMRLLSFHEIDKVYTYLSPDIEYFHGRHLVYGTVALLCTVSIAIGLPLLLTLEPFLNHKINFTKIKPLLDQFQGCYKDKYRCFAGYYMFCRLVIIIIVIANSSDDFVANYLLIITCGIIALIHLLIKPYNSGILNKLDGIILQLIIFTEALTLFDDYDSPLVITFSFVLVILPLLLIIGIGIFLHKNDIKKLFTYFTFKVTSLSNNVNNNDIPMGDYILVIGNTMRANATICDM